MRQNNIERVEYFMDIEETFTAEYIVRGQKKTNETAKVGRKQIILRVISSVMLALIAFTGISAVAISASAKNNEVTVEDFATGTVTTDSAISGTGALTVSEKFTTSLNAVYTAVKEEQAAAQEKADRLEEIGGFIADDMSELVGIMGNTSDIMEAYRADDPELPSYLTYSYNAGYRLDLSEEEITLLAKIIEAEAPSEDIYGKILVANVVLNRVLSEGWPNTVTAVVYQRCGDAVQFSSTMYTYYWNSIVISDTSREAAMRALAGEDYSNGAQFFYGWAELPELGPDRGWISLFQYLFIHGCHAFYK